MRRFLLVVTLIASAGLSLNAGAHPEDEFCVPGETGLDPALCQALSELDSPTAGLTEPLRDAAGEVRGFWSTAGLYVTIGVGHILPAGLDHILFVLALTLASANLRVLIIQISSFTLAHTATLGLAAAGIITPAAAVVEPLIAATIAFVALENLWAGKMPRWRPYVVFGFGLVHGMGFAGFFGELGLPPGQFWSALLGFNIGVEIGQLAIVCVAWLLARQIIKRSSVEFYRRRCLLPASLAIGAVGVYWTIERLLA